MTYPLVGVGPVDVVDVYEHDLVASDISETILNRFLLKNWIKNMCHVIFCKYDVPTHFWDLALLMLSTSMNMI